ncbi:protein DETOXIFICATION 16 [Morus notabilis]|uniref:protein DETOXIFICATION 16 n=1 Tax=Morus notabilis TaxID=981085 RepID=UPI000CECFA53|nr:protein DETOXIFICATION 16 [Morus notabilis]
MDLEERRAPLLLPQAVPVTSQVQENCLRQGVSKGEIVAEAKKQLQLAGPLVCVNVLTNCLQVISVMFVGHLGELALSGASMATSFASVTGFSLLIGMGSALETFCGQSYGGKQFHMLGIHMQRAMLVLLIVSVPLAFIWANAGQILEFLGQDPEISAEAGRYARFMIPSIFAYAITQCHMRFLQSQNNVVPMMVCIGITTLLHLFICWILVFKSGLGNRGAALANAISYWINALSLFLYVRLSPSCKNTWTGFSREAFHGIPKFLTLSIPSAVMLSLEIWSFEMMVLLSGLLPNPKLETSVLSISLNTCSLVYMIPLGLSGVVSARVSNELGAGRPQIARLAICIGLSMVVTESFLVAAFMIFGRRVWGYCYSKEEKVVKYVGEMMLLVSVSHVFDGIQSILSGSIRGSGRQKIGAFVNLAAYYIIGIPSAILLAFVYHIGGKGLWMGIVVALVMQVLFLAVLTNTTDWEKEVKKASERVHGPKIAIEALT